MDPNIDLDLAAREIEQRADHWRAVGIEVGPVTWREQGEGWPPSLKTIRAEVKEADSVGVELHRGAREGSVVLFTGGWADFLCWDGAADGNMIDEVPGWDSPLTLHTFGELLDRLAGFFD